MIAPGSLLFQYMSPEQRGLIADGNALIEDRYSNPHREVSDYSYIVFPYAKAYEGFLKQLFRDLKIISPDQYASDHYRLGKALSPNMVGRLGDLSAYRHIVKRYGSILADELWRTWKEGRNLVLHYFPHNFRKLSFSEATALTERITQTMEKAVKVTRVRPRPHP